MAIVIVRHGETALNAAAVVQPFDTPLSERGMAQARRVAERLGERQVAALWSSDAPRALMTAEPIARSVGVDVEPVAALQERNFGDDRGRPYAEVPRLFARDYHPPAGESWPEFDARVGAAWQGVVEAAATLSGDLVVVTHGLWCRSMVSRFVELADGATAPVRFGNTSVTVVTAAPPHVADPINCVAHLEGATRDDDSAPSGM